MEGLGQQHGGMESLDQHQHRGARPKSRDYDAKSMSGSGKGAFRLCVIRRMTILSQYFLNKEGFCKHTY